MSDPSRPESPQADAARPRLSKLLVVDDNPDNLLVFERVILEHLPLCEVTTAMSAESGLEAAAQSSFDGALIDMQMPNVDGIEMCSRMKANPATAQVPVLLITAHKSTPQLRARGLEAGADDFLSRPVDNLDLVAKIKVMLRIKRTEDELRDINSHLEKLIDDRTSAVRASEERFRQLTENIHEVFWMTTPDSEEILYVSPAYERIWGRTCQSLYEEPKSYLDSVHPEHRERLTSALATLPQGAFDAEYRIIRPDGSQRWIHDRAFPVFDESHEVLRVAGIAEDITQRKKAEEALRRELMINRTISELAQALISQTPEITDIAGITLNCAGLLTASRYGFASVIEADGSSRPLVVLRDGDCQIGGEEEPLGPPFESCVREGKLWGHSLQTRQAFFENEPPENVAADTTRESAIPLRSFMSVPIVLGNRRLGQVVLANAECGYSDDELEVVKRPADLFAIALGRKRADARIREQLAELQRWHDLMFNRENRVLELKSEINKLLSRLGEPIRYTDRKSGMEEPPAGGLGESVASCLGLDLSE